MESVIAITALFTFGGLFTYTICERRHRRSWFLRERRPIEVVSDPFRREPGPAPTHLVLVQGRAPATIRRTALWSIYMGQMAVPGGLLGLLGMLAYGIGLISIPGMILAVRIWRLGYALLRREPGAEFEAHKLHRFAVILNGATVAAAAALLAMGGWELSGLSFVLIAYAAVSFAHAWAMRRCAELLAEDRRIRVAAAAEPRSPRQATMTDGPTVGSATVADA